MRVLFAATAVAVSLSCSVPAVAAPLSASELLHQFNTITFGDLDAGNHVDGRTYVGGNLTVGGAVFNMKSNAPASAYDHLVVQGDVTGGGASLNNGGNATVGGSVSNSTFELNGGGTLRAGGTINTLANQGTKLPSQWAGDPDFANRFPGDVEGVLKAASSSIRSLGGTSPSGSTTLSFDATQSSVFSLTLSALAGANEVNLMASAANPLTINVSGTGAADIKANFLGGPFAAAPYVLWNFYEAESLHFVTTFFGSILAPYAHVSNATNFEGTVVAASARLRGEVHLQPFEGNVPVIPVPATLPLIASAIAGLALLRRRSSAAA